MSEPPQTKTYYLSCHCQRHALSLTIPIPTPSSPASSPFQDNIVCDCSHCIKRRFVSFSVPSETVKVIRGGDDLGHYQFGAKQTNHWVCIIGLEPTKPSEAMLIIILHLAFCSFVNHVGLIYLVFMILTKKEPSLSTYVHHPLTSGFNR